MTTSDWNPRFVLFAADLGLAPEQWRMEIEGRGSMIDFSAWISRRWAEWRALCKLRPCEERTPFDMTDHALFDAWLARRARTPRRLSREAVDAAAREPARRGEDRRMTTMIVNGQAMQSHTRADERHTERAEAWLAGAKK